MDRYANMPRGEKNVNWKGGARNYKVNPETECWEFQGERTELGYGRVYQMTKGKRKIRYAHVAMYEQEKGIVPEGLVLDHLCRNPSCVNPEHLEAVTQKVNIRRGKGVRINEEQAALIKSLKGVIRSKDVPEYLGLPIKQHIVLDIWSGRSWADVGTPREVNRRGARLTIEQVRGIKSLKGKMSARKVVEVLQLPVGVAAIYPIWDNETWKDVEPAVWV